MAEVVRIEGTGSTAKIRHPLVVVALSLVTFGIYFLFWYYFVNREMRDYGGAHGTEDCGTSPGISLLAMTLGWLIIVPPFVSTYFSWKRLNASSGLSGAGPAFDAGLGLLLWILLSPVAVYIFQMKLNDTWRAMSGQQLQPTVDPMGGPGNTLTMPGDPAPRPAAPAAPPAPGNPDPGPPEDAT